MRRKWTAGFVCLLALSMAGAGCERQAVGDGASAGPVAMADTGMAAPADKTTAVAPAAAGSPRGVTEAPPFMRGIYLNAYAAGSSKRLEQLLSLADRTEINTFVVDVKDEKGVHYKSSIELANQIALPGEVTLGDLTGLTQKLRERGIYSIARVVVFKDPILSKAKPEWSIQNPSGGIWVDKAGNTWVSTWNEEVWEYNIRIAEEAARAGFDAIQFDYIRFPEAYKSLPTQVHREAKGERTDAIVAFLKVARPRLHALGAAVQADVFGLSPNDAGDVQIGQQWEHVLTYADHVLPMVYPSHYFSTHLRGIKTPNRMPFETVHASVGIGVLRRDQLKEAGVAQPARVIPWLQAFSAPWVDKNYTYGAEQAAAQIKAVYATGLNDWIFWHPGSKYELVAGAFAAEATDQAGKLEPTADMKAMAAMLENSGLPAIRKKLAAAVQTPAERP